jgi:hypothetical protein
MVMKMVKIISILFAMLLPVTAGVAQSGPGEIWTEQRAKAWFDGKAWLNGLNLLPHKSVNPMEFARQYHLHRSLWDSAFAFLWH